MGTPTWAIPVGVLGGLVVIGLIWLIWAFPKAWQKGVNSDNAEVDARAGPGPAAREAQRARKREREARLCLTMMILRWRWRGRTSTEGLRCRRRRTLNSRLWRRGRFMCLIESIVWFMSWLGSSESRLVLSCHHSMLSSSTQTHLLPSTQTEV
jgi:hypothetical protein